MPYEKGPELSGARLTDADFSNARLHAPNFEGFARHRPVRELPNVITVHSRDLAPGTWADIKSSLTPCLGEGWWE